MSSLMSLLKMISSKACYGRIYVNQEIINRCFWGAIDASPRVHRLFFQELLSEFLRNLEFENDPKFYKTMKSDRKSMNKKYKTRGEASKAP